MTRQHLTSTVLLLLHLFIADAAVFFKDVGKTDFDPRISGRVYRKRINFTTVIGTAPYDESVFETHIYGGNFTYNISGLEPGTYDLTLGFAENYPGNCDVGRRVFNVTYNGGQEFETLLDVYSRVRCYAAYFSTKTVATDESGQIILDFTSDPDQNYPFLSLILVEETLGEDTNETAPMLFFQNAGTGYENLLNIEGNTSAYYSSNIVVAGAKTYGLRVFLTHRYGENFRYILDGFNANKTYVVTLGFAEKFIPNCVEGARVFNVKINGLNFVKDLDVFAEVGCNTALILSDIVAPTRKGEFSIKFVAEVESAMVSFIRVEEYVVVVPPNATVTRPSNVTATRPSNATATRPSNATVTTRPSNATVLPKAKANTTGRLLRAGQY
jgi:hypothetical protein